MGALGPPKYGAGQSYDGPDLPFHEPSQKFFQDGATSTFCLSFLGCWQCKRTFTKRFILSIPKRKCSILRQQLQKLHFVGSSSQPHCDKLQNRLSADFSSRVLFYKEANCHSLYRNHNYDFILPSKTCQHHLEAKAAACKCLRCRPKQSSTLSINPCLSSLAFSR